MSIATVGVIGAGVMGVGVAQDLAQHGVEVILLDVTDAVLERARSQIRQSIRFQGLFGKGGRAHKPDDVLGKIAFSTDTKLLERADFVIENVTEKWELKRGVYADIDPICPSHCVFAANTSAIPITRIASLTKRADRVVGMHFMNPVPMKSVVEVIRGHHTTEETLGIARGLLSQMGKEGIVVNDAPGFVSNRVLMLTINEAVFLLQDQVAGAEQVDRIFKSCFGHKMGPLETADLIGLDTILYSIEVLHESFGDSKYRPCPLLKKMVDAGLHGRKSGRGFYSYDVREN
ncbi:3-hydroxyacyl-CoA dehydrogenase family protein [Chondromyces crocatus]|uniref:3-hydroxybutyryl-CoA dehydrogenase n=1 Tax=Chondromyces crocatus TaxID=52 RepID=A0A0K1EK09_CHOCO|nr:3-hydroxyacyl-CoA dehydrogenase NAD-binding domain-containing protein [Chondromyces crocatus]AKT41196.1 3-hydroxybutyryl-CoA dehydrogenase [Chondromyces crocatus]